MTQGMAQEREGRQRAAHHGLVMSPRDFEALADDGCRYEYIKGVAVAMLPAGGRHGRIAIRIATRLSNHLATRGHVYDSSTGYRLPNGDVRAPDVSVIREGRLPDEADPVGFIEIPPDLAVEIVSPQDRYEDVQAKVGLFLAWGTAVIWVVEPETGQVLVHRADGVERVAGDEPLDGGLAVPGFSCHRNELFP